MSEKRRGWGRGVIGVGTGTQVGARRAMIDARERANESRAWRARGWSYVRRSVKPVITALRVVDEDLDACATPDRRLHVDDLLD